MTGHYIVPVLFNRGSGQDDKMDASERGGRAPCYPTPTCAPFCWLYPSLYK